MRDFSFHIKAIVNISFCSQFRHWNIRLILCRIEKKELCHSNILPLTFKALHRNDEISAGCPPDQNPKVYCRSVNTKINKRISRQTSAKNYWNAAPTLTFCKINSINGGLTIERNKSCQRDWSPLRKRY